VRIHNKKRGNQFTIFIMQMIYNNGIFKAHTYWTCNGTSLEYTGGFRVKRGSTIGFINIRW
jgi:hypothetical protein